MNLKRIAPAVLAALLLAVTADAATQSLPAGHVMTVTATGSNGTLKRLANEPALPTTSSTTTISVGTPVNVGPYGTPTRWDLSDSLTYAIAPAEPVVFTAYDGTVTIAPAAAAAEAMVIGSETATSITMLSDGGDVVFDGTLDGVAPAGITADASAGTWTFSKTTSGVAALIGDDDAGAADLLVDVTGAGAIDIGSADVTDIQFACDGGSVDFGTTANAFVFTALTTNTAVITGADAAGAADTTFDTTGAGAIVVGSADVTSVTVTSTSGLTLANGESINTGTDDTFDLTREDAGAVTVTSSDDDGTADLTIDPGGNAALTLGAASDTCSIVPVTTFTEIPVLPAGGLTAGATTISETELGVLDSLTATKVEIQNECDISAQVQAITGAGAVTVDGTKRRATLSGGAYAITLAAPGAGAIGAVLVIEYVGGDTDAVTLALTNIIGESGGTGATFDADGEGLVLIGTALGWVVLSEFGGVTLA